MTENSPVQSDDEEDQRRTDITALSLFITQLTEDDPFIEMLTPTQTQQLRRLIDAAISKTNTEVCLSQASQESPGDFRLISFALSLLSKQNPDLVSEHNRQRLQDLETENSELKRQLEMGRNTASRVEVELLKSKVSDLERESERARFEMERALLASFAEELSIREPSSIEEFVGTVNRKIARKEKLVERIITELGLPTTTDAKNLVEALQLKMELSARPAGLSARKISETLREELLQASSQALMEAQEIAELTQNLDQRDRKISELTSERATLEKNLTDFTKESSELKEELEQRDRKISELTSERATLEKNLTDFTKESSELKEDLEQRDRKINGLTSESEALRRSWQLLQNAFESQVEFLARLYDSTGSISFEADKCIIDQIEQVQRFADDNCIRWCGSTKEDPSSLQQGSPSNSPESHRFLALLLRATTAAQFLQTQIGQARQQMNEYEKVIEKDRRQIDKLKAQDEEFTQKKQKYDAELTKSRSSVVSLQETLTERTFQLEQAVHERDKARDDAANELQAKQSSLKNLVAREKDVQRLQTSMSHLDRKCDKLESELVAARKAQARCEEQLQHQRSLATRSSSSVRHLAHENEKLKARRVSEQRQSDMRSYALSEKAESDRASLQAQIDALKKEHQATVHGFLTKIGVLFADMDETDEPLSFDAVESLLRRVRDRLDRGIVRSDNSSGTGSIAVDDCDSVRPRTRSSERVATPRRSVISQGSQRSSASEQSPAPGLIPGCSTLNDDGPKHRTESPSVSPLIVRRLTLQEKPVDHKTPTRIMHHRSAVDLSYGTSRRDFSSDYDEVDLTDSGNGQHPRTDPRSRNGSLLNGTIYSGFDRGTTDHISTPKRPRHGFAARIDLEHSPRRRPVPATENTQLHKKLLLEHVKSHRPLRSIRPIIAVCMAATRLQQFSTLTDIHHLVDHGSPAILSSSDLSGCARRAKSRRTQNEAPRDDL
jgi:predicted nuclease with TOPRIM domain